MSGLTIESTITFRTERKGRKAIRVGGASASASACGSAPAHPQVVGRLPRITKLLALAHRFEQLVRDGHVRDYAELARLGRVTRARITQIMNLLLLAPDIQEQILFLPRIERGRDGLSLRKVLPIAAKLDWSVQRELWRKLVG
jgi:hypothetical protein